MLHQLNVCPTSRAKPGQADAGAGSCQKDFFHLNGRIISIQSEVKVRPGDLHELFSRGWMPESL